jgi:hypothetical protein
MRFKRGLLVSLLALFLAACGTQTPAPAIPTAEEGLGEINVTELEAAFDATELTNQKNWDKKKFNKFTLKKVVEGYDPNGEHHKYKLAVICKVPHKKNVLAVVGAGYLKDGQSKHFLVPTKYVKCAAFEFEKFGDEVKFELKQSKYDQYSGVKYYGKLKLWGKKLDFKASEFFHLKRGDAKFIVVNKFVEVPPAKGIELEVIKVFKKGHEVIYPSYKTLELTLICEGGYKKDIRLEQRDGKLSYHDAHANVPHGKKCYVTEKFFSDDYKLKKFITTYKLGHHEQTVYADAWTNHAHGDYDYVENAYKPFYVKYDQGKLVIVIVNVLEEKERVVKKLVLKIVKSFRANDHGDKHPYPNSPKDYDDLKLVLICDDYKEYIELDDHGVYHDEHRSDLYGKTNCYLKEHFKDDDYKLREAEFIYTFDDDTKSPVHGGTYNDHNYDGWDTVNSDDNGKGRFNIVYDHGKIIIIINNKMEQKYYPAA